MKYLVTVQPKGKYRQAFNVIAAVVDAATKADAIRKFESIQLSPFLEEKEYCKPRADVLKECVNYYL